MSDKKDRIVFGACGPTLRAAPVLQTNTGSTGLKYIDCRATYYNEGEETPHESYVTGLFGGALEVIVYPAQFGVPCSPETHYHFHVGPEELLTACVKAVKEELCPVEYVI